MKGKALTLPFGALYLAERLIGDGFHVTIIDSDIKDATHAIDKSISSDTICVGISSMSGTQLGNAITIAKHIKSQYSDIPVVWGGVHATSLQEQTLEHDVVDYIVWGEGEESFAALVNIINNGDYEMLHGVPGIGFKRNGDICINKNAGYTDLQRTFLLPYHLLDMEKYARKLLSGSNREYHVMTSRGCPFACKFCNNSSATWKNTKIRFHTLDHIVNDIKILVNEYNADAVTFVDENLLINDSRLIGIIEALQKEGINIKYRISARVDSILRLKRETWKLLKDYGLVFVGIGVESGSQKILDDMGKRITLEQIYQAAEIMTINRFNVHYNFIVCSPGENIEDTKMTLKMIVDLVRSALYCPYPVGQFMKFLPLPGTEMYLSAVKYGLVPPKTLDDWVSLDFSNSNQAIDKIRPWMSGKYKEYVIKADQLVNRLIEATGTINNRATNQILNEIQSFIKKSY
jgi:radical SAM superfamily enzyme YgiQ (UPF0313 family)